MASIRFTGPAEKMGFVIPTDQLSSWAAEEINPEVITTRTKLAMPLGSVALSRDEFVFPFRPDASDFRATFINNDALALGRDESRHIVRFGQMILNGTGLHERPLIVAVKPFDGEPEDTEPALRREWALNEHLNSLTDRQLAYLPLGVWHDANSVLHMLSLYEHGVISYDNVFWADKDIQPEALRKETVERAFNACVAGLGYLHGLGIVHGDAEVKNLASDRQGTRFIDLESAKFLPISNGHILDTPTSVALTRNDIESFLDSSMQVDENRDMIAPVLARLNMSSKLAREYRAGLRRAKKEAGITMPHLTTQTDEYFKSSIDFVLKNIAHLSKESAS